MVNPFLARFARSVGSRGGNDHWQNHVWSVDGWSVGTDGRNVHAVHDGGVQESQLATGADDHALNEQRLRPFLADPPPVLFRTSLPALWLWLEVWRCEVCPQCADVLEHYGTLKDWACDFCDGDVLVCTDPQETRHVRLGGVVLDADRLVRALAPELADVDAECSIGARMHKVKDRGNPFGPGAVPLMETVWIWSDTWRVIQAGMDLLPHDLRRLEPLPTFHPEPAYVGLWHDRRENPRPFIDWLIEHEDAYAERLREEATHG